MKTSDLSLDDITLFDDTGTVADLFEDRRLVDHSSWLAEKEFRARLNDVWSLGFSFASNAPIRNVANDAFAAKKLATAIGDLQTALHKMTVARTRNQNSSS